MTKNAKIALCAIVVALIAILIAVASCTSCSNDTAKTTQKKDAQFTATDKADVKETTEGSKEEASSESQQAESAPSTANSGQASPATGGGGSPSPSSGGSEPVPSQHEHTWATRTIDDGEVWVVDQAAWDEKVLVGGHYECSCGINWGTDVKSMAKHCAETGCTTTAVDDYDWIHHEEVGHYEQRSHSETYCTVCGAIA